MYSARPHLISHARQHSHGGWFRQASPQRRPAMQCRAERKEFYDLKDMPPLPFQLRRITIPAIGHVVVDKSLEPMRRASLAIFSDICSDAQYNSRLNRKSALTALCMYDRWDRHAIDCIAFTTIRFNPTLLRFSIGMTWKRQDQSQGSFLTLTFSSRFTTKDLTSRSSLKS